MTLQTNWLIELLENCSGMNQLSEKHLEEQGTMKIDPGSRCRHSTIRSNLKYPHNGNMSDRGNLHNSAAKFSGREALGCVKVGLSSPNRVLGFMSICFGVLNAVWSPAGKVLKILQRNIFEQIPNKSWLNLTAKGGLNKSPRSKNTRNINFGAP